MHRSALEYKGFVDRWVTSEPQDYAMQLIPLYLHVGTCCVKTIEDGDPFQAERVLMLLTLQNAKPMKEALQKLEHPWLGTQSILSHLKLYIFLKFNNII